MKQLIFSLLRLFFRAISKAKRLSNINHAIKQGMLVGENTLFVGAQDFGSEPFLIEFGSNCLVTDGVRFVTHDGSIQVPLIKHGETVKIVYSKKSFFGKIVLGNNVFVGAASIILPNTIVRDNTIIAAGSIVKGSFDSDCVIGGNPARVICTVDEYYKKIKKR